MQQICSWLPDAIAVILLAQELLLSQLHVRHLLDLCCRHLSAYGPAHSASVHLTVEGKVAAGVTLALRYVILHSPQSLVALDLKPIQAALDITTNIEVGFVTVFPM